MSSDLTSILTALTERLLKLAEQDELVRSQLRQLAESVLQVTEPRSQPVVANSEGTEQTNADAVADAPADTNPPASAGQQTDNPPPLPQLPPRVATVSEPRTPLPELTLGRSPTISSETTPSRTTRWISASDEDLPWIESRCRLKAKAARWAATRRRLIAEGAAFATAIDPFDRDLISDAKALPECFLWMCHPSGPSPADARLYDPVAACFVAVADLLAIMRQIREEPDLLQSQFEPALNLLAEAQSALRVAIGQLEGPLDNDQLLVFNWLKTTTAENQVFIEHYMRADDPADPALHVTLAARIERLGAAVQATRGRVKQRRKLLGKVRHKASLIANDPDNSEEQWLLLAAIVDELIFDGLPPSNRELRELLLPVIDDLPELPQLPHGFHLVLSEIDRFLAQSPPHGNYPRYPALARSAANQAIARGPIFGLNRRRSQTRESRGVVRVVRLARINLDRDSRTSIDRGFRAAYRPARRRGGALGDPLVEPLVRRGPRILRPSQ
jgi:hypothetical protein